MNKNEAKAIEVGSVLKNKKTNEVFVVDSFDIINGDYTVNGKLGSFSHRDLLFASEDEVKEFTKTLTKENKEKNSSKFGVFEVVDSTPLTQEDYDKTKELNKKLLNEFNGNKAVISFENGIYKINLVGSPKEYHINARDISHAKRVWNFYVSKKKD